MRDFTFAVGFFFVLVASMFFLMFLYVFFAERSSYESIKCMKCGYEHLTEGHTRFTTFVHWNWHKRAHRKLKDSDRGK